MLDYSYGFANSMPVSYLQLTNSSRPCFYCRGGGKYFIWDDYKTNWEIVKSSTTYTSQTVAPTTSLPANSYNIANIGARASNVTGTVAIANGGTGATTASGARSNLGLSTVASTGSYNDLSNKPSIPTMPTVGNGTLTIQKNGSTVASFTANATSGVTANIGVPTGISISTTSLKGNSYSTSATTVAFSGYIAVYCIVRPTSSSAWVPLFIPANLITTTATEYQGADEGNYVKFKLQKSGSNIVITGTGRSGSGTFQVYGVKLSLS